MRCAGRRFGGISILLLLASACGGPTAPSKASSSAPSSTGAQATIAFVKATPAPGSDLIVDPGSTGKPVPFAASFSLTIDRAVSNAAIELSVMDGGGQSCGSGTSDAQDVAAGQATTFSVASVTMSCAPPASIEMLKATLVGGVASPRAEYASATFPAHYALRGGDITVTLNGTVTEARGGPLAGATVDVTDGPDLGKSTTTDSAGRYILSGLKPGASTVRAGKVGYDNSYLRVSLASTTVTQDFTIAKSAQPPLPRPGSAGIFFVSSDPAPGGEAVMSEAGDFVYLRELRMQFAVQFDTALPDAKLEIELFGDAGQQCAYAFVDHAIAANQSVAVPVDTVFDWQFSACAFPAAIASVRATLLTLREPAVNGRLTRTDYGVQSFPLRYSVRRYPAPPPNPPESAPVISDLSWRVLLPVAGDPPLAGDPVSAACTAKESDGAAMTVTLTLSWDHLAPLVYAQAFPAGASSSPAGARLGVNVGAPTTNGQPAPHAKLECVATNDRGQSVTKATDIGRQ